jgi:DNA polymerase-3 subunit beta
MKFTVLQENLKNSVSLTSHFVSSKAQLPILGNILIKADKTKLTLSATNLETSIETSIAAKVEEEGDITINGKTFNDVVSNLESGSINIESFQEQIKITSGKFKSNLLGSNSSDFPSLPSLNKSNTISLKTKEFIEALSKVLFAVSFDETRPILTGVLFWFKEKKLHLVATDGFRLSEIKLKNDIETEDLKIIIPKAILYELTKISGSFEEILLSYDKESNQIVFGLGETILSSRVIEGEFPDYEKIIPSASMSIVNVDKNELEKSLKLASVFARDSGKIIKIKIENNELKLTAESSSSGNQETTLEIRNEDKENESKEINIMFNYSFIEDVLKVIADDEVKIIFAPDNKASKFLDPKTSNFLHIIMPIKSN